MKLADALVEAQQSLLALDLVTQKYQTSPNVRHSVLYLRWLAKYYQDQQRQTAIAYIKEALFLSQEIEDYRQLRRLMQTQDNWQEMRHSVLQQLAADQEITL